ncbi:hypothetical protein CH373_10385 [Leptospira perolatii]|uniref:Uncharacterized protein n=1 Tax=Leptospira perolatii TaxID=2023191 RepID=A0A2M9ZN01_9LEPT|nr:hypothetical protein [Leptospira perolatii]PJZ68288.1 hypothetical protein CH360_17085 [Leptospira perolatii]PJZ73361.1 hypothetical protein CH373_10385 [Leptospira perolatii]
MEDLFEGSVDEDWGKWDPEYVAFRVKLDPLELEDELVFSERLSDLGAWYLTLKNDPLQRIVICIRREANIQEIKQRCLEELRLQGVTPRIDGTGAVYSRRKTATVLQWKKTLSYRVEIEGRILEMYITD